MRKGAQNESSQPEPAAVPVEYQALRQKVWSFLENGGFALFASRLGAIGLA
jgi:hypothetical protein